MGDERVADEPLGYARRCIRYHDQRRCAEGRRGGDGSGVALQAKRRFPGIEFVLGELLQDYGNHVQVVVPRQLCDVRLVSFPVKHHWREKADLLLIQRSVGELVRLVDSAGYRMVALPRPGCGNGGLEWEEVGPLLRRLDDRFVVVHQWG